MTIFYISTCAPIFSQEYTISGKVQDAITSAALPDISVVIGKTSYSTNTDANGNFVLTGNFPAGPKTLIINGNGYVTMRLPILIENGISLQFKTIPLKPDVTAEQMDMGLITLTDNELANEDDQANFNVNGLLGASNDAFFNAAAYDFSATFFRPRGLGSEDGKLLINGMIMNKQFNGRPQWGNWGGLNDLQRNREFSIGLEANNFAFGDLAGVTNLTMRASQFRQGGRISYASSNRTYTNRVMGSYSTGLTASGWAFSLLLSRRAGETGIIDGTPYNSNSVFVSVERKFNDSHSLNFSGFYTPNQRGRGTAITQEVTGLKGVRYNPNWGYQNGELRNFRVREIKEPILMLNHHWKLNSKTKINTNLSYQFGEIANSRLENGGTRLITSPTGQKSYVGGARNPAPNYYQNLPGYFLRFENPDPVDFQYAYLAEKEFVANGQLDWEALYAENLVSTSTGGNSIYLLQEDVVADDRFAVNTLIDHHVNDHLSLNAALRFHHLRSENFARVKDLLGGTGYLDIDNFVDADIEISSNLAQSDLRNPDRLVTEGDRYKYNYEIKSRFSEVFVQADFTYAKVDFFLAANVGSTSYQRNGIYENGYYTGDASFGESQKLNFTSYGAKAGLVYKITGRHLVQLNSAIFTEAPTIRNSFPNARQNNFTTPGLKPEQTHAADLSYIYRSPILKARLTGYLAQFHNGNDVGFFFTQSIPGRGIENQNAFVQEIVTGIERQNLGLEFGAEIQITPTLKIKAAAAAGQFIYTNNPNLFYTSDDFDNVLQLGDGTAKLKNYHIAGGPENAFQLGLEYRDPDYWWVGVTGNYFSNAFVDVSALRRSPAFTTASDGQPIGNYDIQLGRELLRQEKLDSYSLVNIVGGKSWRIKDYYLGLFATINNVLDQEYRSGGFEDSRIADYEGLLEEHSRQTPLFGNRYFFGYGSTYYFNVYVRF
ncbi:MAG: carboxypeptidase-like regulatory domain-containing protein [Leeuwenhoekiella sp.]